MVYFAIYFLGCVLLYSTLAANVASWTRHPFLPLFVSNLWMLGVWRQGPSPAEMVESKNSGLGYRNMIVCAPYSSMPVAFQLDVELTVRILGRLNFALFTQKFENFNFAGDYFYVRD